MEDQDQDGSTSTLNDADFRDAALNNFQKVRESFDVEDYEFEEVVDTYQQAGVTIKLVDEEGGGEGDGEYCHLVYSVTDETGVSIYWMVTGFHSSDYGIEWDNEYKRVEPKEVKVIKYVKVK